MVVNLLRALTLVIVSFLTLAGNGGNISLARAADATETAIFAGGCFWCVESDFDHVPGVLTTTSGYTGGTVADPTYKIVTAGGSGHYESVQITFDPETISYAKLLDIFWRTVDPTDDGGQFCDRGASYKTAIFTTSDEQQKIAEASKRDLVESGKLKAPIVTLVAPATEFYPAEEYHQNFYEKSPVRYKFYRFTCGRDAKVESIWGDEAHRGITEKAG